MKIKSDANNLYETHELLHAVVDSVSICQKVILIV